MLQQPIIPPSKYAGINMAKDDLWHGLSIEDAEAAPPDPTQAGGGLCQSVPLGFIGGCPSGIGFCNGNYWGNNAEVNFFWNLSTHLVDQMTLNLGYQGAMTATSDAKSKQGAHTYVVKIGDVIKKDGQPFLINWSDTAARDGQITEIYNAVMYTFAAQAGVPYAESPNCHADGNCLVFNAQGTTIFGIRPMAVYFQGASGVPQPALSTPTLLYNFSTKYMPYSNLPQLLTLDKDGPVATGISRGAAPKGACGTAGACPTGQLCGPDNMCHVACSQKIGVSFKDMKTNCIQVTGDNTVDTVNLNKVLYGLSHDFEHWTANIMGVNQNFTSSQVVSDPNRTVLDTDTPQDADLAQDWTFDIRARGRPRNDINAAGRFDMRGSALVYIEWARLMLLDVNRILTAQALAAGQTPPPARTLGDANCTNGMFAAGCSGLEGLIIPSGAAFGVPSPSFAPDPLDPGPNQYDVGIFYGASILKPGDIVGGFCVDPGSFTDCAQVNSPWDQARNWVLRLMGKGNLANVPSELRDRRYYFKWFAVAYLKYLKAYSHACTANPAACNNMTGPGSLGPSLVDAEQLDNESLFFDNNNQGVGNGFDKFEYVDRENIGKGQEGTAGAVTNWVPWDFEYGSDIIGGNQRYDNWYRRMDREEIALYSSMLTDKVNHTPGQENNVNITNLFGSPVLAAAFPSYACAIGAAGDPIANCNSVNPPTDPAQSVACTPGAACGGGGTCIAVQTLISGVQTFCSTPCSTASTCASATQACVVATDGATKGCVPMKMDLNGAAGKPMLWYYPGAWSRTPYSPGHSPISIHQKDKKPFIGAALVNIPNFKDGPYTASPALATYDPTGKPVCPTGWTADVPGGNWCNAPLTTGTHNVPLGAGAMLNILAPTLTTLTPWIERQPGAGFSFPIDGQHDQFVQAGTIDFTGVLETYELFYQPWIDTAGKGANPSCASGLACGNGYTCDPQSKACVKNDDTIQVLGLEAQDFLGAAFLCQDPTTGDLLGVHQYDSAQAIIDWMANHPGGWSPSAGAANPSAQVACNIIIRQSPANNYVDFITSKSNGVKLSINQGSGQGRVTDILLYDPGIVQTP